MKAIRHFYVITFMLAAVLSTSARAQDITTLEPGKAITRTAKRQQVDTYQLTLTAGQFIRVIVEQTEVDVMINLVGANNQSIHSVNLAGAYGQESLSWEAATSGVHKIAIRTLTTMRSGGTYQLSCAVKDAADTQDKQRIQAEELMAMAARGGPNGLPGEQRLQKWQEALQLWHELGDRNAEGYVHLWIGRLYVGESKYEQALERFRQALAIQQAIPDQADKAFLLNDYWNLSRLVNRAGALNADLALRFRQQEQDYLEQALEISRRIKHSEAKKHTLANLALHYYAHHLPEKELEPYESLVALARANKNRREEADNLQRWGYANYQLSRYEKALELYMLALPIFLEVKDRAGEAVVYRELGNTYGMLGRYDKAIENQELSLPIWRELKNQLQEGSLLNNLGFAYAKLNRNEKAIEYLEQAIALQRQTKNRYFESGAIDNLAFAYSNLGQYEKAMAYSEQAVAIIRELRRPADEGFFLGTMALIFHKQGNYLKAIETNEKAISLLRAGKFRADEGITHANLADSLRALGQIDKAIDHDLQALQIARETKARDYESFALKGLMKDWHARSQPQLAILFGKQAVNVAQEMRGNFSGLDQATQKSFLQSREQTYRDLADVLIAQGRLPEAEQVIRMLKEEEFFEYVRRDKDNSPKGEKAALTPEEAAIEKRYREIADKLTEIGTQRGELLAKEVRTAEDDKLLAKLEADLTVANQAFQKFLDGLAGEMAQRKGGDAQFVKVREAQGLMEDLRDLGKGTVALYTLVGENKFRMILTTPDVQKAYEVPIKGADLNRKVLAFRTVLQNPKLDPRPAAEELYKILFAPLAKDLEQMKAKTLMWSLDGVLRYVPIAALYDGKQYLVERFQHVMFTNESKARMKDAVSKNWHALGLGVTRSFGDKIPALPAVAEEMRSIINDSGTGKGVLPGTIKLDEQFTQEAMMTGLRARPPVVHVASHFQFQPGSEMDSALLLGDGKFLSLAQINVMATPFSGVELLTLSACNTATSGSNANGKEVEGFGMLAQRKGAKAVVASLWPVADRTTRLLMEEFYRGREARKLTKGEALRQAQGKLLRGELTPQASETMASREITHDQTTTTAPPYKADAKRPHAHPYYWAPFILIGNWK
ncbi:MAG TPA: CHAT domain-containing tetratricopeptide repeat protein [Blastocatellia bacterium]|nr:CHAT domain-containing tetratricopeptide repeat protein [Blastocatellia bacterium]